MSKYKKIPLVKSRVTLKKREQRSPLRQFMIVTGVLALMLIYVWLNVQSDQLKSEIRVLEKELQQKHAENQKLQADAVELSSFGRIQKIARDKLGMIFIAHENIIEIK